MLSDVKAWMLDPNRVTRDQMSIPIPYNQIKSNRNFCLVIEQKHMIDAF